MNQAVTIFSRIDVSALSVETTIGLIIVLVLLISSALISGSETAFFSLSPSIINKLKDSKSRTDKLIIKLFNYPDKLLATILIANNLVNIGIVIVSTYIIGSVFDFSQSPVLGFVIEVIAITFIILLFGEIIPKIYAQVAGVNFVRFIVYPINFLHKVLWPISYFLLLLTRLMKKKIKKGQKISVHELSKAIDITTRDIQKKEKEILKGIVTFGDIHVKEIMKARIDVTAASIDMPFEKLINLIIETGYSRIPVYEDTFDNIKGILFIKDLVPYLDKKDFEWQQLIKPSYFVPENKMIDDLFDEFKKNKVHMAVVIDEYGGTSGIITMEDILEEIVGEINDESDTEEYQYVRLNQNTYIFEGKVLLNDFCKITKINDDIFEDIRGESETLAGLLLQIKGEIPTIGQIITYRNITFTIELADIRRIKKIKVVINPEKE